MKRFRSPRGNYLGKTKALKLKCRDLSEMMVRCLIRGIHSAGFNFVASPILGQATSITTWRHESDLNQWEAVYYYSTVALVLKADNISRYRSWGIGSQRWWYLEEHKAQSSTGKKKILCCSRIICNRRETRWQTVSQPKNAHLLSLHVWLTFTYLGLTMHAWSIGTIALWFSFLLWSSMAS